MQSIGSEKGKLVYAKHQLWEKGKLVDAKHLAQKFALQWATWQAGKGQIVT